MSRVIVDTNVPVVANERLSPQTSAECVITCVHTIRDIQTNHILVIDDGWHILREYRSNLRSSGQPGVGDAFLKWVLTNQANPDRCERVHNITLWATRQDDNDFVEFPDDPDLAKFDRSDRKFVAIALTHPEKPPILNATDRDWWHHRQILDKYGIQVEFLCPEMMA